MKVWIKYLIGCVLGIIAGIFLPGDNALIQRIVSVLTDFSIHFGRWTLIPTIFFSMTLSICNLREEKKLVKVTLQTVISILITSLAFTIIGIIPALIFKLPRIPISVEKVTTPQGLDFTENLLKLFPFSGFESLLDGNFILPAMIMAIFVGAAFSVDRNVSKPAFSLFDSFSHVCYQIMAFFVDALSFGMVFIGASWTSQFISMIKTGVYTGFILLLVGLFIFVVFAIYPLLLRFAFKELHPFKILYATIASMVTSFFSMDVNLSLVTNYRHAKESLGIRRRINSTVLPFWSAFGRGGTACVTAISFVVILRSYSGLGIAFTDVLWIIALSFVLSFLLSAIPVGGPFVAITILCTWYGRGFDAGYLLLKPAMPIICAIAASIDTANALLGTYLISAKNRYIERKDIKKYI
ncbi:MAG: cation:dicarboxylase symporter family transporter [Treponemataceae bacterium]|nr:cation:dicarboxylase symporter family transporter [Treponemataceae bacterium]